MYRDRSISIIYISDSVCLYLYHCLCFFSLYLFLYLSLSVSISVSISISVSVSVSISISVSVSVFISVSVSVSTFICIFPCLVLYLSSSRTSVPLFLSITIHLFFDIFFKDRTIYSSVCPSVYFLRSNLQILRSLAFPKFYSRRRVFRADQ